MLILIDQLAEQGITISHLDLGGGLGVPYDKETPPEPTEYMAAIIKRMADRDLRLIFEPGRAIMANAGVLVTKIEFLKLNDYKNFTIVDAAMNDLIRPALYSAWQNIIPLNTKYNDAKERPVRKYDIVGPICETGDFLGKERMLGVAEGDYLVIRSAGAYGATMSSNYNSRCRSAEILVDGEKAFIVREREELKDLWRGEHVLPG